MNAVAVGALAGEGMTVGAIRVSSLSRHSNIVTIMALNESRSNGHRQDDVCCGDLTIFELIFLGAKNQQHVKTLKHLEIDPKLSPLR